jgi:hypothetical protein
MSSWIPGFSTPIFASLFALLIPLIIFYFLKLKRPRMELPSLALWRQVISDQRVNSPFQRFKRNILLLLQIALLCLLALAAMQPFWKGDLRDAQYLPVLVDNSASMGAKDEKTGQTRLDLVKEDIRKIINGLLPGQQISLISVSSNARRLTEFTDNRPLLLDALDGIQPADVPSKLEDGLRLAQALSRTNDVRGIRLYSDGNLPTRPDVTTGKPMAIVDFDLPFKLDFQHLESTGNNIGITAFNARRTSTSKWDVFVRLDGSQTASTAGKVTLRNLGATDNAVVGEEQVILAAKETQRLVFTLDADKPASLEVTLKPEGFDALDSDNKAWLELPIGRDLKVFCPDTLGGFRHALEATPGILLEPMADGSTKQSGYDLVITDALADAAREAMTYCFVGVVPEDLQKSIKVESGLTDVVDWKRDASLLQHVQLRDVQVMDNPKLVENVTNADVEALGYEYLAHGAGGPLILQKRDGSRLTIAMLFHTDHSTLPYRIGFPVMVSNLANIALQQAELAEISAPATGSLPRLFVQAGEKYRITSPSGEHFEQTADARGALAGIPSSEAGLYEVRQGGKLVAKVGASLLNQVETSLAGVDEIHLNEVAVAADTNVVKADKPWWLPLVFAAFGLLLIEWWVFQKRPSGLMT